MCTPCPPTQPCYPPPAQVAITFKNQQVLKDISWDVKKGERVGLVGVNGAGKTTQLQVGGVAARELGGAGRPDTPGLQASRTCLRREFVGPAVRRSVSALKSRRCIAMPSRPLQIIIGKLTPDSGEVIKAKENMKIAYLTQV